MNPRSLITLLLFFVLQALIYCACLVKLAEIRRQRVPSRVQIKLLENEEHLFDGGLYLGFAGTIVCLILVSLGIIQQTLMAAYSSTAFGVIFVSIFKIFNLRPARRQLLLQAEARAIAAEQAESPRPPWPQPHEPKHPHRHLRFPPGQLAGLLHGRYQQGVTNKAGAPQLMQPKQPGEKVTGKQDLGDVMRLALDEERKNRDQLVGELTRTRAVLNDQDAQIKNVKGQLLTKEQLAAQLAQEQANLQNQFAAAQTNIANLNEQLHATTVESLISKEQRAAMEAEARKQAEKASALEKQLAELRKNNESMQSDRMALQNQLQMSEASNRASLVQMSQLQEEVDSQRRENVRLADGVKVLAAKSSDLAKEIHDNRPLTPNMIFEEMSTNRVLASFTGVKTGVFGGDSSKDKQTQLILVTDETNTFALCHVQDTPLTLWSPGTQWEELRGTLVATR
jgi:hypothetical protein